MPTILRTRQSRLDYNDIWDYIAQDNVLAADRVIDQIEVKVNLLASTPALGRPVEELAPNLRSFPLGSYLIFYRPMEGGIQLIRVIHGAREITPEYFPGD